MGVAAEILKKMTLDQKIGQLTQYNGAVFLDTSARITGPDAKLNLTDENLINTGSVLNLKNADEMIKIQSEHLEKDENKIPMVFMMDVIHGYRTIYPIPLGLACSFDTDLVRECASMAAKEASVSGVQVTFAPMVDYVRDARWGRVMETCGEEPLITSDMAAAQIEGFSGEDISDTDKVGTCVKHFAGYGAAEAGRDYNLVELSERELRQYYLPAYKAAIDAGADLVMPSFNSLNGVPSVANPFLMKKVLRDEWGFNGVVISDYAAVNELITHGVAANLKDAARLAFENGCDIEMCSVAYFRYLKELVEDGTFSEEQIDIAVLKVLELKEKLGLFKDPYHGADPKEAENICLSEENRALAKKAAAESAVLLKNENVLPLSENIKNIAVIGPFADEHAINGSWHCMGKAEDTVTVAEGIRALIGDEKVITAKGCDLTDGSADEETFAEAVNIAASAEAVVLCLGEPEKYSGEGNCRTDICLPGIQSLLAEAVIKANKNTAVLLFNGRPLAIPKLAKRAPAILEMWMPGTEGGTAAAELLFGRKNPSGKLTMSFPYSSGQCPIYYNRTNTGRPHWTAEENYKSYTSNYIDAPTLPVYSFGYGLSYSNFIYEKIEVSSKNISEGEEFSVTVTVRNDSDAPGSETVQIYMQDPVACVVRPVRQLIAYKKVFFNAEEEKQVSFTIKDEQFKFINPEGNAIREKGLIKLMAGCADDCKLSTEIELI